MTRRPISCGATGIALQPDAIASLDFTRVALQLKSDGLSCTLTTDAHGRIDSARSQLGRDIPDAADLIGIVAAPPYSTLHAEFESHTERGRAAAAERGFALAHLFDCTRLGGQHLLSAPYAERHGALYRAQSWCESEGHGRARDWTLDTRGNAHATVGTSGGSRDPIPSAGRQASRGAAATRHGGRLPALPGRFVAAIPRDLRRLPVLPLVRGLADALALWSQIERDELEGAVAVDLRARVGAPRAKRKIKLTDTIGATVLSADASASLLCAVIAGRPIEFTVAGRHAVDSIVEVAHEGFYRSGVIRHARVVRRRCDKRIPAADRMALVEWRA